ncbi:MAG: PadR family transcriptional regulator [Bacteroidetes bacterium]|jgi:PadR family transcriptional regulator, regulatory protein PadR|nr:MAG: PadR family transcriptional regulator [Bacteroidota bacterium]
MNIENTQVQMRKGILEFCIMHIISNGQAYSSDILKELKEAKIIVVEGTLYPLLTRLKNAGLLDYVWKESAVGPPQKHYKLTTQGETFLEQLNETWIELVESTNAILKRSNIEAYQRLMNLQLETIKLRS